MRVFSAIGLLLFGVIAIVGVIHPFVQSMMPTISDVGNQYEIAMWGILPILLLVLLIPAALYTMFRKDKEP